MKETITSWIKGCDEVNGIMAYGVRFPDRSVITQSLCSEFHDAILPDTMEHMIDTFQVLNQQRQNADRCRWTYQRAVIHCAKRGDNTLLMLFTPSDEAYDPHTFEQVIANFLSLK